MTNVFNKLVFVLSGTLSHIRKDIAEIIESHGGSVVDSVTNKVDYVISESDEVAHNTNKIKAAKSKHVPILKEDFLDDCIAKGKIVEAEKYTLEDTEKTIAPTKQKVARKLKEPTKEQHEKEDQEEEQEEQEEEEVAKDEEHEAKTNNKRKAPKEKKTNEGKKVKTNQEIHLPKLGSVRDWTQDPTPITRERISFGFTKVSKGGELAQRWAGEMEGIQLGSEASYDWEPFVVQVPESWSGKSLKQIMDAAIIDKEMENSAEDFKTSTNNLFTYNANKDDEEGEDDEQGKDEETKLKVTKDMREHLTHLFDYEYTGGDSAISSYPKFVGGYMKDDKSSIVGLFSCKVET